MPGVFVAVVGPDGVGKTTFARALLEGGLDTFPTSTFVLRLGVGYQLFPWRSRLASQRARKPGRNLVVADHWAYGYLAQPDVLKCGGPQLLARCYMNGNHTPDIDLASLLAAYLTNRPFPSRTCLIGD